MRKVLLHLLAVFLGGTLICGMVFSYLVTNLPDISQLKDIHLQVPLTIYTVNGDLIGEFGEKHRIPIAFNQVPKALIQAILDTEDRRFYEHPGVDFIGLVRAAKAVYLTGKKVQGASTITMQVARNFFLDRKKTYVRKLKEILLAIKIDHEFNKNEILKLYLNKIYFGQGAYGVAAAAHIYYGKEVTDLTLPQLAMLAGLPQAPSRDNPITNSQRALARRNHVLARMLENHDISQDQYNEAINTPLSAKLYSLNPAVKAPYVAEMVRNMMVAKFGQDAYDRGFKVYTTINSRLQKFANLTLENGLIAYSKRHGYIGTGQNFGDFSPEITQSWQEQLSQIPIINNLEAAVIIETGEHNNFLALLKSGKIVSVNINWPNFNHNLTIGDVILLNQKNHWELSQIPQVNGALIAMNPNDGAIVALTGGFSYALNKFNCAIQAQRQPGSSFKPFIYSAALAKGFTLASIFNDAPIVRPGFGEDQLWRPQNVTQKFSGPTRLRVGLTSSGNLVSVRILQATGIDFTVNYLQRFGFKATNLPTSLSLALGTAQVTPLELTTGYAVFANGGYKVDPFLIAQINDEHNNIIFQAQPNTVNSNAPQVITPQNAYLINDALRDVIKTGTGRQALVLKRSDLAGKTGTTNDQVDAWFAGFNKNLVTTVWVGFNQPKTLNEYGAQTALPIWISFMRLALRNQPLAILEQPAGLISTKIDPKSGLLAYPGQQDAIFEIFRNQYVPKTTAIKSDSNHNSQNIGDDTDELF